MVREAVVKQYGVLERISNELQRRAGISEPIVEITRDNEGWPVVRVVTHFVARKHHGTDCTASAADEEGWVRRMSQSA